MTGLGALLAALGVILGAFGAHALKGRLDANDLAIFETAVRYHLIHAVAIVAIGEKFRLPAWALVVGITIFSGSLYLLVLTGQRWLGAITPIGGLSFIFGWIYLAWLALRSA